MRINRRVLALMAFTSVFALAGLAGARAIRIDNPGYACDMQQWGTLAEDPYMLLDGNSDGFEYLPAFFRPGTVTTFAGTPDTVYICVPNVALSSIWNPSSANYDGKQVPNYASKPDENNAPTIPSLTATAAVLYEWANDSSAVSDPPAADVQVIVWTLPRSSTLPQGAFEIELDNWCGPSPAEASDSSTKVPPRASSSFTWNGHVYTAACSKFGANGDATDLLVSASGALTGYVDASNTTRVTSSVPGWTEFTLVSLAADDNLHGIGILGAAVSGGGLDGKGSAYAGNLLGSMIAWEGATFQFASPGGLSAATEKVIPLPAGQYSTLKILGAAVNGGQTNQTFVVTYSDGTQSTFTRSLSNWNTPERYPGESTVLTMPYKLEGNGSKHVGSYNVYGYSFALDDSKVAKSLTLPGNHDVVVLAVDVGP